MANNDAPPSYESATAKRPGAAKAGSNAQRRNENANDGDTASVSSIESVGAPYDSSVSRQARASMEDEARGLPQGWVRQFDPSQGHHFYVNTQQNPPKSYWTHPYDIPEFAHLAPSDDIGRLHRTNTERQQTAVKEGKLTGLGRKLKDKLTSTTHEERVAAREREAEREREAQRKYEVIRRAYLEADRTGRPVLIGTDRSTGQQVFAQPSGYGGVYGGGYAGPATPYGRRAPYGGYGGAGLGLPLLGGLLGGMLLGDALFGF